MLYLNCYPIIEDRGITNPLQFLVGAGFNYHTANRLLNGPVRVVNLKHLEMLCLSLNCSLEDIIFFKPDKGVVDSQKHPLKKFTPKPRTINIKEGLKALPPDKLETLKKFLSELNDQP